MYNLTAPTYEGDINEDLPCPEGFRNRDITTEPIDVITHAAGTETLVISFGGCGYENGEAIYSFGKFLQRYIVSHIQVRDHFNVWYLNGIRGISTNVASTVIALQRYIEHCDPSYVICTGTSCGGFGAILYGVLLGVDRVVAITPQTLLQRNVECVAHGNLYKLKWTDPVEIEYRDLLNLPISDVEIRIIFGHDDPVDVFHSGRMSDRRDVRVIDLPGNHATVALDMRDNGDLDRVLALNEEIR